MFASLLKYREKQYSENHSIVHLNTCKERLEYEIYAFLVSCNYVSCLVVIVFWAAY